MNSFPYLNDQLHCENVPLSLIAHEVGTPVYVYSQQELLHRAAAYQSSIPSNSLICYAVKANGNLRLLQLLSGAGLGADVTSGGELFLAQQAGIRPQQIIYSGVGKRRKEIETALRCGVRALHVESEMELTTVAEIAAHLDLIAPIGVRINPNISADTHPYISTGLKEHKFGVPAETAMRMMLAAAKHPYLRPIGIAAHLGSQITALAPYAASVKFLTSFAEELKSVGVMIAYVDAGGGLGIDYTNESVPEIGSWVNTIAIPVQQAGYSLVVEPGRSIVGPAGILVTEVLYIKRQGDKRFVIADAGMSDLIRPTLYGASHHVRVVKLPGDFEALTYDIVGPICESGDFLAKERELPPLLQGDLLAIMDAGAYGYAMSSNYNGQLRPAEVLVAGDDFKVIRQRQTLQHLLDGCL